MTGTIDRKTILRMIRDNQIPPEEGLQLLRLGAPSPDPAPLPPAPVPASAPRRTARPPVTEIAVIGMAGRFPGADTLADFWRNLCQAVDSVSEVPGDRWDVADLYDPDIKVPNKTYCKWAGLLSRIDQFDPVFFGITPREAELMDPQQRLFLEEAWKALESAGYSPEELNGRKCGVFAGAGQGDYATSARVGGRPLDSHFLLGSANSVLAARIAYVLNLTGPNMAIDTACSSSLVAIHQACQSIASGDCDMALAGGVTTLSTPDIHITSSKGDMLTRTGKCRTFDNDADGFVPGEGVGVVVLKPLAKALEDGDTVWGVIRGWGVNHDGRTNGLTAPSASSQTSLLTDLYDRFHMDPGQITYVEAHGTGTKLGDPIEVSALTKAFRQYTQGTQYCAVGSVKTNIGHTLAAAGVASLIKVLLCLRHKKLVPSLHLQRQNEHIQFDSSPFYVNTAYKDWSPPDNQPRMAAISSFGLSGTNCHLVVAEAPPQMERQALIVPGPHLIPLSAKTEGALMQRIRDLNAWLDANGGERLSDMSYTLSVGRTHFPVRCAIIARDVHHLKQTLERMVSGEPVANAVWSRGMATSSNRPANGTMEGPLADVAVRYVDGEEIPWKGLVPAGRCRRIPLPTYPLSRMAIWHSAALHEPPAAKLHPLVAENRSTFSQHKYSLTLTGREFFLTDHMIQGEKMVPGAALMEMARAAAELAGERPAVRFKTVFWVKPVSVQDGPVTIHAVLSPDGAGGAGFQILSGGQHGDSVLHAQGTVLFSAHGEPEIEERIDLAAIRRRCNTRVTQAECYSRFRSMGVAYGPTFQCIQEMASGDEEALASLQLEPGTPSGYVLHPALLDGALQSVLGVGRIWLAGANITYLPFALGDLEVRAPLPASCYVYVSLKGGSHSSQAHQFDICLTDSDGVVLAKLGGYSIRPLGAGAEPPAPVEQDQVLYFTSHWIARSVSEGSASPDRGPLLVIGSEEYGNALSGARGGDVLCAYPGGRYQQADARSFQFRPDMPEDYHRLVGTLAQSGSLPETILLCAGFLDEQPSDGQHVRAMLYLTQALMKVKARRVRLLYVFTSDGMAPHHSAVAGFAKSLRTENPNFRYTVLEVCGAPGSVPAPDQAVRAALAELTGGGEEPEVRYDGGERHVRIFHELRGGEMGAETVPLRHNGVYLITGGAGGLGLLFARYLARQCQARVVLVGRSPLSAKQEEQLRDLEAEGAEVTYLRVDVTDAQQVHELIGKIKARYGELNGIIHSAGVLRDSFILSKTADQMRAVLAPKVNGSQLLDQATAGETLDFFVLFSALAGVTGNVGQCDYASANAYLDRFAELRQRLVKEGKRTGRSVAINWPLWQEGGMAVTDETARWLKMRIGMSAMRTGDGIEAFLSALRAGHSQVVVVAGHPERIRNGMNAVSAAIPSREGPRQEAATVVDSSVLLRATEQHLKEIFVKVTGLPAGDLDLHERFESYGVDSIVIVAINNELESCYDALPKTLLFECKTIADLAAYIVENHTERVEAYQNRLRPVPVAEIEQEAPPSLPAQTAGVEVEAPPVAPPQPASRDIAIIGLSGRYPMARDLDQFWELLKAGRDCITEVPADRWDHTRYFDPDRDRVGTSYSKWGGFIDDVDKFDPLFFNISPREAERMDPQERLFLEAAWQAVEDAGYTRSELARSTVGVFVGVMYGHYQLVALEEQLNGSPDSATSGFASIANRVSYTLDLKGPSIALDTMCSSSLTSIHLACHSMLSGECDMAIAGGVNLTIHPAKYLVLSQGKFAASDGRCRTFGADGDGYVPGEGVGTVVLKPLARAVADGDHIYGVIKGTSVNHGGKSNGFTVPDPNAQADVIAHALLKAGVDPHTINYIEAHGTGTSLGDPIEIRGLTKAFRKFGGGNQHCAIGSVKSNIGHLESAAGIAALTKVLLQMRHNQLAPSIHSGVPNPNIDFENSPFYVQRQLADWHKPKINQERGIPRRAGVSAFGAGGSNAHVIMEAYEPGHSELPADSGPQLIVLSARTEERLKEKARRLAAYLEQSTQPTVSSDSARVSALVQADLLEMLAASLGIRDGEVDPRENLLEYDLDPMALSAFARRISSRYGLQVQLEALSAHPSIQALAQHLLSLDSDLFARHYGEAPAAVTGGLSLASLAYTLQVGREPMEVRLSIPAASLPEVVEGLRAYSDGAVSPADLFTGTVSAPGARQDRSGTKGEVDERIHDAIRRRDLRLLAEFWVQGQDVDWQLLYPGTKPRRVSLPTYPFAGRRYWLGSHKEKRVSTVSTPRVEERKAVAQKPSVMDWDRLAEAYDGDEVTLEIVDGNIALVTMQDRRNKNMFSDRLIMGLMARFAEIRRNPQIKAVVLTGYENIFCMGGTHQQLMDIADSKSSFTDAPFMYRGLLEMEIPVVSAIQGHASGGGMLFGLYADIIIMSQESVYTASFMKYGFTPGMGATFLLREKLGPNLATEMMFTARSYRGEELQHRGASVIFRKSEEVLPEALSVARMLAEKPIHSLTVLKKELAGRILAQLPSFIDREADMHVETFSHPEVKQRIDHYFPSTHTKSVPAPQPEAGKQALRLKVRPAAHDHEQRPAAPPPQQPAVSVDSVRPRVARIVCEILHLSEADLRAGASFQELGADSVSGLEIVRDLNKAFGLNLEAVTLYDYPTIDLLVAHVAGLTRQGAPVAVMAAGPEPSAEQVVPAEASAPAVPPVTAGSDQEMAEICRVVSRVLRIEPDELDVQATFQALGADSVSIVEIVRDLNSVFGLHLDAVVLYDYPTISELARHIRAQRPAASPLRSAGESRVSATVAPGPSRLIGLSGPAYEKYRQRDLAAASATVPDASAGRPVLRTGGGDGKVAASNSSPKQTLKKSGGWREPEEPEEPEPERAPVRAPERAPEPDAARSAARAHERAPSTDGVAVIGMAGRFPGAANVLAFWNNLKAGGDSIIPVPKDRWDVDAYYDPAPRTPGKTLSKVGGFLEDVDQFDPLFFNISPLEAETMDPQQRIFLEEAWNALEDAGYTAHNLSGARCGVFVGAARGDYTRTLQSAGADTSGDAFTGLAPSILAARVSYWLNLKGPSIALDTACSSSLVAIHLACQSILTGECDMAIAGGVRLMLTPEMHVQTSQLGILSPTGKCRAFDQNADGTILSEAVGVVILKPLRKALADQDRIYGVIRGTGVNQDGKTNGITAPSAQSQTDLELEVYRRAGINPEQITYVEAHGTGTKLGDPIEVKALKNAFEVYTKKRHFCAIGSVKTNIGHTTMAAGVASLIKVLLSFKYRSIPPSLHFDQPNEHIHFEETPFYVNTTLRDWVPPEGGRRIAAVSSFGYSGTNCHLVVEEPPADIQ